MLTKCTPDSYCASSVSVAGEEEYFGRVELTLVEVKMDVKFSDAVNWKPNVSCQFI